MSRCASTAVPAAPSSSYPLTSLSPSDFMKSQDLMSLLHVSDETLSRMRYRKNGIPFIRVSQSKVLYRRADVEAWLAARVTVPAAATA